MKSNEITPDDKVVVKVEPDDIPAELPILPLYDQVAFPTLNMALTVPVEASPLMEAAMKGNRLIGIVGAKSQMSDTPDSRSDV